MLRYGGKAGIVGSRRTVRRAVLSSSTSAPRLLSRRDFIVTSSTATRVVGGPAAPPAVRHAPLRLIKRDVSSVAASPPQPLGVPPPRTEAVSERQTAAPSSLSPSPSTRRHCLLCDATFSSWSQHCSEPGHVARTAVCTYFVMPERSESLMDHLERHIQLDLREVDALAAKKVERRRRRLLAGMLHLVEEGVLTDSLPLTEQRTAAVAAEGSERAAGTRTGAATAALLVKSDRFLSRLLLGEAHMRRCLIDRAARLMPSITGQELDGVVTYLMSTRQLARLFDELSLQQLLTARDAKAAAAEEEEERRKQKGAEAATEAARGAVGADRATAAVGSSSGETAGAAAGNGVVDPRHHPQTTKGEESRSDDQGAAAAATAAVGATGTDSSCSPSSAACSPVSSTTDAAQATQPAPPPPLSSPPPPRSSWRLTRDEKASVVLSLIGELEHHYRQDRPRSVLSKRAADTLVLRVIATHARDNVIAELLHAGLQRIIEEGTPVWREHQSNVRSHALEEMTVALDPAAGGALDVVAKSGSEAPTQKRTAAGAADGSGVELSRAAHRLPLSSTPMKAAAAADDAASRSSSLDVAGAADEMLLRYLPFKDVDGVSDDGAAGAGAGVVEAQQMSPITFAKLRWGSMEKELGDRLAYSRRMGLMRSRPILQAFPTTK